MSKHPLYNWNETELDEAIIKFKQDQEGYDFKLIIAYTIYNEEDFIEESLENCLLINDLDGIHILDGAWIGGGDNVQSTDKTITIIDNFMKKHPELDVVYHVDGRLWNTQGDKRSYQLKLIEERWGKSYIIIKDGDETIQFNSGKTDIWLKKEIVGMFPAIGILKSYAWGHDRSMIGARILPTGMGIHYHTDKSMIIHDDNCNILCDYNIDKNLVVNEKCFTYDKMFYVNRWNLRNRKRQEIKDKYATEQVFGERDLDECRRYIKEKSLNS